MKTKFIAYTHVKNPIVVYLFREFQAFFLGIFPVYIASTVSPNTHYTFFTAPKLTQYRRNGRKTRIVGVRLNKPQNLKTLV